MSKPTIEAVLRRFDVDRAVFFGLLAKLWGLCAGPVTALLIATRFSPEIQGYYYTFATLLSLQMLVELGLGTVITQFASHEWAHLRMSKDRRVTGQQDSLARLASLAKIASKWYLGCSILIALGLSAAGYLFFSTLVESQQVNWLAPWVVLCVITGINVGLVPIWSLLEGCNQIGPLYTFRFFQGLLTSAALWTAMLVGAELWTPSVSGLVSLLTGLFFVRTRYWGFLVALMTSKVEGPTLHWRTDLLPMQWRIAVSWISGYFIYFLFVPVLFRYQGPVVAGQMGMTWSLAGVLGLISSAWVNPRAPQFGILIAQKKYQELDKQLLTITKIVTGACACVALLIWTIVVFLNTFDHEVTRRLATRILPPLPTGLFLLAQLIYASASPTSVYLRAHKREPLMVFSVVYALLIGVSTFLLGKYHSVTAVAIGYFSLNVVCTPIAVLIWYVCRRRWHAS